MHVNAPIYTAYLICYFALMAAVLTIHVIRGRVQFRIPAGSGENPEMVQRIRAHGNFTEHTPIALIAFLVAELISAPFIPLIVLGLLLAFARTMAAWGISTSLKPNRPRVFGAGLTIIYFLAITLLILFTIFSNPQG